MVKVQSATQVRSGSKMTENTSGGVSGDAEQNISKEVNFESNARLRGAEVKEVQKVGKDTYVLLVLDKLSARSGLLLDSSRIKSKLDAELDALEAGFSAARLKEAKADLDAIRDLSSEASVLGMGAVVDASPYESRLAKLDGSIRAKNEKKIFALKTLKGDDAFARAIEVCLQDQGASVYTGEVLPEGSNQVQVSVIEHAQHMNIEGWVKTRFEVTANIVASNGKSYRVIENQTETARTREAGLESASEEISKKLCDQIWNRVGEMK